MNSLGINVGSSSIKVVMSEGAKILWQKVLEHEGNLRDTLASIIKEKNVPASTPVLTTGNEGRYLLNTNNVLESICIEEAIKALNYKVDAVVSLGGEISVVYTINSEGKIITSFSGNKCASGTGEFFKQQLGRMDMKLDDIANVPETAKVHRLASRCSVFMKSDCTHKLNKGEATKYDIVLSLSDVTANKVADFLKRAKIKSGKVIVAGGVTRNKYIVRFLQDRLPDIEFIVPEQSAYFEAYGASLLAASSGSPLPALSDLFRNYEVQYGRYPKLSTAEGRVKYIAPMRSKVQAGREYILGVDGGSTTTKVALIDYETKEIVASHYGRTHGDPVNAVKECLVEVKKQLTEQIGSYDNIKISLVATTGSSREILGVFLETPGVYNEIIAHAYGTTFFQSDIDTIFEIGGQDAKYVSLRNKVPIDYAMNEACSAGTGSFIEESAAGDLNIVDVHEIGEIATAAQNPLKFGEHCSAFINSDIRKAIQLGASREDITAGIITSIVSNYLNRVVGNRSIGKKIVLQGGVALNKAIPLAFSMLLNKDIIVPPNPELLGCFGVAILAAQKAEEGFLEKGNYTLDGMLASAIVYEREFKCQACENMCPIRVLAVNGHKYMFGGRCNKYANMRRKKEYDESKVFNYVDRRNDLMFKEMAPTAESFTKKRKISVGIPRAFSIYTMWPFYSWFFHTLGIEYKLSGDIDVEGYARTEGQYCFPAEIAHGAVQSILNDSFDYIFVPHFRDLESYEDDVHANFCPITQSLPYYIKKAFPEIEESRFLAPIVSFKFGNEKAFESFKEMCSNLGISARDAREAFDVACAKQHEFWQRYKQMGLEALENAKKLDQPVIALLGRPYNAFTRDANMGIPLKFASRGYSVIPFDMLPFEEAEIFDNMYWYYGQQDMKSSMLIKDQPNIFATYVTNFSCAPDSFMLHYMKWIMGSKPFLILELDSHSADAGVDTRVEAFLDIIEGYRSKITEIKEERYDNGYRFVNKYPEPFYVENINTNERVKVHNNPKVTMLLSSMGRISSEVTAAALRHIGINSVAMPVPDTYTLQIARNHMSGKECIPSQLVLGSALKYLSSPEYKKDQLYLLFVPTTTGPCRTGQYYVFYENLFKDLKIDNILIITLEADNSYNELGPEFMKDAWWGVIIGDYMKDIETSLRALAVDPVSAMKRYDELWSEIVLVAEKNMKKVAPTLEKFAVEIAKIPLKRKLEEAPKVLIVGEIYVRRDDFAVDELVGLLSKRGIIAKVSGIAEWIYYCDYTRRHDIMKKYKLHPWYRRYFTKEFRDIIMWQIEEKYKHYVDHKIHKALAKSGLIPTTPHDMKEIMENANTMFVNPELYSEISISAGAASTAMLKDFSGVINISPFACLIGRVIEGLVTPWARERNYPMMSVEIDGDVLPPNVLNKLEIFMLNVLRFRNTPQTSDLVEKKDNKHESLSRKIVKAS
jgi:predicted CoA-substrate-specific enzyme activase